MPIDSFLPECLVASDREQIEYQLEARRLQSLTAAMRDLPMTTASRDGGGGIDVFLLALQRLLNDNPERILELVRHWSVEFFLPRSAGSADTNSGIDRLNTNLLFECLSDGRSPLEGLRFQTRCTADGSLPAFVANTYISIRKLSQPFGLLVWKCGSGVADVWRDLNPSLKVKVPIPLDPAVVNGEIEFCSFPVSDRWQVPLIKSGADSLSIDTGQPKFDGPQKNGPAISLDIAESLSGAYEILTRIWPEVLDWAKLLIPAIAEAGGSPNPNRHYSGSFGPGLPIYLSRVTDPFVHAEDLLHELQHQRFCLTIPIPSCSGRSSELRFISPYRTDPRPLAGLFLGVHAFVAVNELRLRAIAKGLWSAARAPQLLHTHRQNLFTFRTISTHDALSSGEARLFCASLASLLRRHSELIEPMVNESIANRVQSSLAAHSARVGALASAAENKAVSFEALTLEELEPFSGYEVSPDCIWSPS
jgi:hypothetical protein